MTGERGLTRERLTGERVKEHARELGLDACGIAPAAAHPELASFRQWLRNLYGFAIAPHMVFYLNIDVKTLIGRVLESRGMDFWESGMDLKHGDEIYESFRAYQQKLLKEYASMSDEFHFRTLDARRPVDRIQEELRRQVAAFLEPVDKEPPVMAKG